MDLKSYIAILFTVVFLGKFLLMDAKILEGILDSYEVVYVNPSCEKNKSHSNESEIPQDLLPATKSSGISIDSYCNAAFNFQIINWEAKAEQPIFLSYSYTSPGVPEIFKDSFYPPPKVV